MVGKINQLFSFEFEKLKIYINNLNFSSRSSEAERSVVVQRKTNQIGAEP